jgi:hypothetical protein
VGSDQLVFDGSTSRSSARGDLKLAVNRTHVCVGSTRTDHELFGDFGEFFVGIDNGGEGMNMLLTGTSSIITGASGAMLLPPSIVPGNRFFVVTSLRTVERKEIVYACQAVFLAL